MTKKNIHNTGIDTRIQQLFDEEGSHILAIIKNVLYCDKSVIPVVHGELDILKLYSYGSIGIEEVKSSEKGIPKARDQMLRAQQVFKFYDPETVIYIAESKRVIKDGRY